ncbi:MAG: hypothetical protein P8Y58_07890 [Novosphingobium sp.]
MILFLRGPEYRGVLRVRFPDPLAGLHLLIQTAALQAGTLLAVETFSRESALFRVAYGKYTDGGETYDANEKIQTIF